MAERSAAVSAAVVGASRPHSEGKMPALQECERNL